MAETRVETRLIASLPMTPTPNPMTLYKNKYRIESARLPGWDYSSNGWYFITICTHDRQHFFGTIRDREMQLSIIGEIVDRLWHQIPNQFPGVALDEFVVMPNHIHGVIEINDNATDRTAITDATHQFLNSNGGITKQSNPMLSVHSISKIIRWYKGRCTFEISSYQPDFRWQSRFYDRIIRDAAALNRIQTYIYMNPKRWETDSFYS